MNVKKFTASGEPPALSIDLRLVLGYNLFTYQFRDEEVVYAIRIYVYIDDEL